MIKILANPDAIKIKNTFLIHNICQYTQGKLFMELFSLFVFSIIKAAITLDEHFINLAAQHNTQAALDYLLNIYSESAIKVGIRGRNIFHYAMIDNKNDTTVVEEKIIFICKQYPDLV